jgi:hypothetical protein
MLMVFLLPLLVKLQEQQVLPPLQEQEELGHSFLQELLLQRQEVEELVIVNLLQIEVFVNHLVLRAKDCRQ